MIKADKIGFSMSVLCAIHCAVGPLLLTIFPIVGAELFLNHEIELLLIGSSVLIAAYTLQKDFFNYHRKAGAIILCFLGFALIIGAHFIPSSFNIPESVLASIGGFFIAFAYFYNWRLRKAKACKVKG